MNQQYYRNMQAEQGVFLPALIIKKKYLPLYLVVESATRVRRTIGGQSSFIATNHYESYN